MGADPRRKGAQYERDVSTWFKLQGVEAGRTGSAAASSGSYHDTYDLYVQLPITPECKNQKAMALASWLDQAVEQAEGTEHPGVVIHKRKGVVDVGEHYATMRVKDLLWLIRLCSRD